MFCSGRRKCSGVISLGLGQSLVEFVLLLQLMRNHAALPLTLGKYVVMRTLLPPRLPLSELEV